MMKKWISVAGVVVLAFAVQVQAAGTLSEAIELTASRLVQEQVGFPSATEGSGTWQGEEWATGSISLGLVSAYERTGSAAYMAASLLSRYYIGNQNLGSKGDAGYALVRFDDIKPDPWYIKPVEDFYAFVASEQYGGTAGYIVQYADLDPSMSVLYLAHHVLAAYRVEAAEKTVWREGLLTLLSAVDDSSAFPVQALACATWALATIGPLENSLVDPSATPASYWYLKRVSDLPRLLLDHQVPEGEVDAGSFFWKFDHLGGGTHDATVVSGYTEDCAFAILALLAVQKQYQTAQQKGDAVLQVGFSLSELESAIARVREVAIGAVRFDGSVLAHVSFPQGGGNIPLHVFAGELLHALCAIDEYESQ
ncbi:hypothetical protein ACFL6U_05610 [Planctomycetota bacterium]